jgi:hypothetical protein
MGVGFAQESRCQNAGAERVRTRSVARGQGIRTRSGGGGRVPFELAWEPRGVVVTYSGLLVADEILECHRRIAADLRFDDLRFAIVDTLPVRSVSLSRADVEQIDAFLQGPAVTNPAFELPLPRPTPTSCGHCPSMAPWQTGPSRKWSVRPCRLPVARFGRQDQAHRHRPRQDPELAHTAQPPCQLLRSGQRGRSTGGQCTGMRRRGGKVG